MATGVEELVDMLFAMIDEAKSVPLSSEKCIIERDKALDILDEIRADLPAELKMAREIVAGGLYRLRQAGGRSDPQAGRGQGQAASGRG